MTATNFALRQCFDDFDAFMATMKSSGGSLLPMTGGPWRAALGLARIGDIQLYWALVPPQIRQGAIAEGDRIMASAAPRDALLHLGHEFTPSDVSLVGPGAVIDSHFRQPTIWTGLQFAPGVLATLAEGWAPRLPGAGGHAILRVGNARRGGILRTVEACLREAVRNPEILAHAASAAALEDLAKHAVVRTLADPERWIEQPRATAARRRVVHAAVEHLSSAPAADWTLTAVAAQVGVSPRAAHDAFAAVYGCSPHAFVKRWRLVMVRRALLSRGEELLVKTTALDHGFWHLGRFAADYRALFGESPQETRRTRDRRQQGWSAAAA